MNTVDEILFVDALPRLINDGEEEKRLRNLEGMRARLRSRDIGQELETSRLMIQRLVCLAELYDSPKTLLLFSREIARQLDAMGNLVLRAQVQQEADSIIGRLMEDILSEMNGVEKSHEQ